MQSRWHLPAECIKQRETNEVFSAVWLELNSCKRWSISSSPSGRIWPDKHFHTEIQIHEGHTHFYLSCDMWTSQTTRHISVHHACVQLWWGCMLMKGWGPKVNGGTEIIDREVWEEERRERSMGECEKDNTERENKAERGWQECLKEINSLLWTAVERKGVAGVVEREKESAIWRGSWLKWRHGRCVCVCALWVCIRVFGGGLFPHRSH